MARASWLPTRYRQLVPTLEHSKSNLWDKPTRFVKGRLTCFAPTTLYLETNGLEWTLSSIIRRVFYICGRCSGPTSLLDLVGRQEVETLPWSPVSIGREGVSFFLTLKHYPIVTTEKGLTSEP